MVPDQSFLRPVFPTLLDDTRYCRANKRRLVVQVDRYRYLPGMNNLAVGYQITGQLNQAVPLLEQTLERRKTKLGPDHPDTLISMGNLAEGYLATGQLDKALPLFEQTLELRKTKLGPDHPHTLTSMNNLAGGYVATGQLDEALPLYEQTLELSKTKLGPDHRYTLINMYNLLSAYATAGQADTGPTGRSPKVPGSPCRLPSGFVNNLKDDRFNRLYCIRREFAL